ncbi:MAG TPA: hypothetical protein VEY71_04705 [Chitinophagales bacterium]|nr:hypothetical protein [Chitinophagales bacterium]
MSANQLSAPGVRKIAVKVPCEMDEIDVADLANDVDEGRFGNMTITAILTSDYKCKRSVLKSVGRLCSNELRRMDLELEHQRNRSRKPAKAA